MCYMAKCDLKCLLKSFLCVTSFINCFFGIIIVSLGVFLLVIPVKIDELEESNKDKIQKINDTIPDFFPEPYNEFHIPIEEAKDLASYIATLCLFTGVIIFLFGVTGCCAIYYKTILVVYFIDDVCMTIIWITITAKGYDYAKDYFMDALNSYKGIADTSLKGALWTGVMVAFECCGMTSYQDFHDSPSWPMEEFANFTFTTMDLYEYLKLDTTEITVLQSQSGTVRNMTMKDIRKTLAERRCTVKESTNGTLISCCVWLDSNNFKTPVACCKDVAEMVESCHVDGLATSKNNWMDVGCDEQLINHVNVLINSLLLLLLFYLVSICFIAGFLLWLNREQIKERFTKKFVQPAGPAGDATVGDGETTKKAKKPKKRETPHHSEKPSPPDDPSDVSPDSSSSSSYGSDTSQTPASSSAM